MIEGYQELITKTFCLNSIRSVTLIDDEVLPYHKLIEGVLSGNNLTKRLKTVIESLEEHKKSGTLNSDVDLDISSTDISDISIEQSNNAALISRFFQDKKIICDIDANPNHIDHERIRKSDLIILDYHLESNDPTKSLDLIYKLSNTPHMNMVVLYTSNELDSVWRDVALTLRGHNRDDPKLDLECDDYWDDKSELNDYPIEWDDFLELDSDVKEIVLNNSLTKATRTKIIGSLPNGFKKYASQMLDKYIEEFIFCNFNVITKFIDRQIQGNSDNIKWVQAGNVFVTFYKKGSSANSNDEPKAIWDNLIAALHDWKPNYYRLILSEIQNRLENLNLSMDKSLSKGVYEQASILWNILDRNSAGEITDSIANILSNVHEEMLNDALLDKELASFISDVANNVSTKLPDYVQIDKDPDRKIKNQQEYDDYHKRLMCISLENVTSNSQYDIQENECRSILHAFNKDLSTIQVISKYITTGVILLDKEFNDWYLCVSPSCNTVAGQGTDELSKRMTPHRTLRFLKLFNCSLSDALNNASRSKYIFVNQGEQPIALSVQDEITSLPRIEYGVVHNHDDIELVGCEGKEVSFFVSPTDLNPINFDKKTLYPVAQLRPAYAARFQNIQSHYEGRIGVDFLSIPMTLK